MTETSRYTYNCLKTRIEGGTLIVSFNRPSRMNAINSEIELEFYDALRKAETDENIKVVLLKGEGRVFSAGHDYDQVAAEFGKPLDEVPKIMGRPWMRMGRMLPSWEFSKPLIAAVHNFVGPHALGILLTCDVVIAAEGTRFSVEAIKNNPTGVPFGPYTLLPFYFPLRVVKKFWLGAGWFDEKQGLNWGFVQRVTTLDNLENEALKQCKYYEKISGQHYQDCKKGIHQLYEIWGLLQMQTLGYEPYQPVGRDLEKFLEHVKILKEEGPAANTRKRDAGDDPAVTKV